MDEKSMKFLFPLIFLFSGVSMAIEEPDYTIVSKTEAYEIRNYGPLFVAETQVDADFENAGNQAFRILAGYIFGSNKSKTKIAMTAPVSQQDQSEKIEMTAPVTQLKSGSKYLVQFTMPKNYNLNNLPTPNDSRVHLREVPARKVAVFTYSGSWSASRYQEKLQVFLTALKKDQIVPLGEPVLARYDSPFRLWLLRRNEIWIEIAP